VIGIVNFLFQTSNNAEQLLSKLVDLVQPQVQVFFLFIFSTANAIVDHCHSWLCNCKPNKIVSMAVASDGSYDIPRGVMYSFPVRCGGGKYEIVQGFKIDSFAREKMNATYNELEEEKKAVLKFLSKN